MRKRKWRKMVLGLVLGILLGMQMCTAVFADEPEEPVDGSWLIEASETETEEMIDFLVEPVDGEGPVPFNSYLFEAYAKLSNAGGGKVTAYAVTKAGSVCDTVKVDIYLQYYSNGAWVYVNNWNYTVRNDSYIARSRTVSVTKGRYYRIKCFHKITKNGVSESCTSVTDGIKIN